MLITYDCECGETYNGSIQLFITDTAENTVVEVLDGGGSVNFADRQDNYTVVAIDAEGNILAMIDIGDNEIEEPIEPEVPSEPNTPTEPGEPTDPEQPVEDNQPTEPDNNDKGEVKGNSNLFPILISIFAVLGIGGVVTFIIIKNKKSKNKNEKGDK